MEHTGPREDRRRPLKSPVIRVHYVTTLQALVTAPHFQRNNADYGDDNEASRFQR